MTSIIKYFLHIGLFGAVIGFRNDARAGDMVWSNTLGVLWSAASNWSFNQTPGSTDRAFITNVVALNVSVTVTGQATLTVTASPKSYTWNGGSGDWSVAGNWTPNGVPGSTDTATINDGIVIVMASMDVGTLNFGGGTLNGAGMLRVNGVMNWTGGIMSGSGRTLIAPGATLNIPAFVSLSQRALENAGTVLWTGSGNLSCDSGVVLTNRVGALWEVRNNQTFVNGGGAARFDNAGTLRKTTATGTTTFADGFPFNNYHVVEVQSGTLAFKGGGLTTGTFDAASGWRVEWSGGTYNFDSGVQLIGAGIYTNSATIMANSAVSVPNLDLTGTVNGAGTLTVSNVMNWFSGSMFGTGRTLIAAGAVLNLPNSGVVSLSQRALENAGTVFWTGSGNLSCDSGVVLTNRVGALWEVRNNQTFFGEAARLASTTRGPSARRSARARPLLTPALPATTTGPWRR